MVDAWIFCGIIAAFAAIALADRLWLRVSRWPGELRYRASYRTLSLAIAVSVAGPFLGPFWWIAAIAAYLLFTTGIDIGHVGRYVGRGAIGPLSENARITSEFERSRVRGIDRTGAVLYPTDEFREYRKRARAADREAQRRKRR